MIALASVASDAPQVGTRLQMELTVDHQRKQVGVTVAKLPFFDPPAEDGLARRGRPSARRRGADAGGCASRPAKSRSCISWAAICSAVIGPSGRNHL